MSPSEVIIEVYIMPEDAACGALSVFQRPFPSIPGVEGSLQTFSFFISGRPDDTAWPLCVLTGVGGQREEADGSVHQLVSRLPWGLPSQCVCGSFCVQGLTSSTPSLALRVSLSHS